ncbi:MAG: 3-hydroxyacyl-CoA dehydrogenase, partial [Sphingomonadales bacterium]|nr:3-hydroxyacyl-CoA dehydrogenase [Sphingomonadales bacterium]
MEHKPNIAAPEASTDERASDPSPEFEPVPLRYRTDGWTPAKQREFVEALRDSGVIRQALARVGLSEQGLGRLRRRPEARAFDLACVAAQRSGVRDRLVSTAYERAIEGTVRGRYYHGELVSEERVYNDRLLMFLIGKLAPVLEPVGESRRVEEDWEGWMEAIETGAPPPCSVPETIPFDERPFNGNEVWQGADGDWWTSFPPPPDFDGTEGTGAWGGYQRTLSARELEVIESEEADELRAEEERRNLYFGFDPEDEDYFDPWEAETSETSAPSRPLQQLREAEERIIRKQEEGDFTRRRGGAEGSCLSPPPSSPDPRSGLPFPAGFAEGEPEPQTLRASAPPREPNRTSAAPDAVDVYVNPGLSQPDSSAGEHAMDPIATHRHGDVLVVTSNSPPVNALGHAVRAGLVEAIRQADSDEAVKAVVIICQGQTFFAGADISEFGTPKSMQPPVLPQVVDIIENCTKPVVAAIHGTAFGGGLEVALASHYRVAVPSAKLGVPEVKLGLLPGAGGTQRLPRVAGVGKALEMAATGNPISAKEAYEIGLVDRLIEGDLEQHAVAYAEEVKDVRPIPRTSQRQDKIEGTDPSVFAEFRKANARKFRGFDAPEFNIQAIEAAVAKPYAEGVQDERRLFMELMSGTQARAQQYFFFAERKASKIDGLPEDTRPRDIRRVGVIGAGTMGGGISMNFLSAGIPVTIVEMQQEALDRGTGVMRSNYEASAAKGRITADQVEGAMGLLKPTLSLDDLADCDLIIEAVFENMDVKKEVFGKLDGIAKPGAILASNTSYLNIDEIAASTSRPQDVLGLHFFSPANVMKLLEVVRGAKTAPDVLVTAMGLAKKIRKVAVVAGVCYGFIGNRMLIPRQTQAMRLLLEGATPEQVDRV